jgi:hypothetical protein
MTDEEFQKSWEEVGGLKMFGPWRDHPGVDREHVVALLQREDLLNKATRLFNHSSEFAKRVMAKVDKRAHAHRKSGKELRECRECNEWQKRYDAAFEEELAKDPIMQALLQTKPPQASA